MDRTKWIRTDRVDLAECERLHCPGKGDGRQAAKDFGEALGFNPITSTLILGEHDAVLVDAIGTVAEAEALADWVALHNRNLSNTVAIEVPLMKQWGQKPEF
jgi:hypothetical protein